jgi:acetyltransferase EpsM
MPDYYILGAGGNARVVIDIINEIECHERPNIVVFDDTVTKDKISTKFYRQSKYGGTINKAVELYISAVWCIYVNAIGDPVARQRVNENFSDLDWKNIIHPSARISPTAKMGIGNIIYSGAVINANAVIGDFNLINTYADIEHDCVVGNYNSISPRVVLCGGVKIGNGNMIGAGAVVIPSIKIGDDNVIGAGSAIIRQIDVRKTIVGVPGREIQSPPVNNSTISL